MRASINEYCVLKEMFFGRVWGKGKDFEQRLSVFHLFSLYDMQIMFSFRSFGCGCLKKTSEEGGGACKAISLPTSCEQIILYNILIKAHTMNKFCAMSVSFSPLLVVFFHFMPPERDENHELVEY